jgi:hypothetical protein
MYNIVILKMNLRSFYIHVTLHRNKFLFNNQPDASVIQIYSVIKLLFWNKTQVNIIPHINWSLTHPIHHALREQLINTHRKKTSSVLTLLGSCHQNLVHKCIFILYRQNLSHSLG